MRRSWKIVGFILGALILGVVWLLYSPADIRPDDIMDGIEKRDFVKGRELVNELQKAYGEKGKWLAFQSGRYEQIADWYDDKLGIAGWDELPQKFQMTSILGTDNSEFTLMNGVNQGQTWGVEDWKSYHKMGDNNREFVVNKKYQHKLVYKNYWFQFPFRFSEAPIIAYAGEGTVDGERYDLLYATWGSETPNREYDQYVLYLNKESKMIEWLHFTVREAATFFSGTAQFSDFKTINGIVSPFSQYITYGKPRDGGMKLHENRYQWIEFGGEKVMR